MAGGFQRLHFVADMPAQFSISDVENNADGWGPMSIPDHLAGIPYAPFGKSDKVGKISDFTQAGKQYGGKRPILAIPVHTI